MPLAGVLLALLSAALWGGGDFYGGVATRRAASFQVLALSAFSGFVMLAVCGALNGEQLPDRSSILWAIAAGISGSIGIACLYRALAGGNTATVAPTAAVITAAVPVLFSIVRAGVPRATQLVGFVAAAVGIWLVARTAHGDDHAQSSTASVGRSSGFKLAIVSGCGFGGFLTFIAQVTPAYVFGPLAVARIVTMSIAVVVMVSGRVRLPSLSSQPLAHLAGLLDASGNISYMIARKHTTLAIAAVLSSLYPVSTVIMARTISKDPVSRTQWVGVAVCILAVVLISL